jgi:hypothetical protein
LYTDNQSGDGFGEVKTVHRHRQPELIQIDENTFQSVVNPKFGYAFQTGRLSEFGFYTMV